MLTESFTAHDSDGNIYEIIAYSGIDVSDLDSITRETRGGLIKFRTSGGLDVIRLSKGRYLIVKINIIVESTDPNAY